MPNSVQDFKCWLFLPLPSQLLVAAVTDKLCISSCVLILGFLASHPFRVLSLKFLAIRQPGIKANEHVGSKMLVAEQKKKKKESSHASVLSHHQALAKPY